MCFASLGLMIFHDHRVPGVLIWFVAGNFFLFCNVFRVARSLELAWTLLFVCLAALAIRTELLSWPVFFLLSSLAAVLVVVIEIRKPSYHGIGWKKINPDLLHWWDSQNKVTGVEQ